MTFNLISKEEKIVGAYITDHSSIAPSHSGKGFWLSQDARFLPILNLFSFNEKELRLSDPNDPGNDIETHNKRNVLYTPSKSVVDTRRLSVSVNDLLIGDVKMLLNFMDVPVVVKGRSDIPKTFQPLHNTQLQEYHDKILILSFESFNCPSSIQETVGLTNYFDNLRYEMIDQGFTEGSKIRTLEYLSKCWVNYKPETPGMVVSNSIKLVKIYEYSSKDFIKDGTTFKDLYCNSTDLTFRKDSSVLNIPTHPQVSSSLLSSHQLLESLRDNGFAAIIVDNDNHIGARYINFINKVLEIPRVKDTQMPEGLYLVSVDSTKSIKTDAFTPLEKIDETPNIYKTKEEAKTGADLKTKTVQEHEMAKLNAGKESIGMRTELERLQSLSAAQRLEYEELRRASDFKYDTQRKEFDLEMARYKQMYEDRSREMELRYNQALKEMKLQEEDRKGFYSREKHHFDLDGMHRKHHYDTISYERDSTLEGLKTVGSVAGLLAGGYVIYKQLSK